MSAVRSPASRSPGPRAPRLRVALLAAAVGGAGCIKAPAVVIVDRKTALEQQAAGSFRGLEDELEQAGLSPRAAPVTSDQLDAAGVRRAGLDASADDDAGNDLLRADALLVKRCIGEALDGTLAVTVERCTGTIDVPQVGRMLERLNRDRRQIWRWLGARAKGKTDDEVRDAWRKVHLSGVPCGGQIEVQTADDKQEWTVKAC